jgi:hypothetical protein
LKAAILRKSPDLDEKSINSSISDLMTLMAVEHNPTFFLKQSGEITLANLFEEKAVGIPNIAPQQKEKYAFHINAHYATLDTEEQFIKYPSAERKFHEGEFFKAQTKIKREFKGPLSGKLIISQGDVTLQEWVEKEKEVPIKKYLKVGRADKFSYTTDKKGKSSLMEVFQKIHEILTTDETQLEKKNLEALRNKCKKIVDNALGTNSLWKWIRRIDPKVAEFEDLYDEIDKNIEEKLK